MNQRAVVIFESKQGDNVFQYCMPLGATWEQAMLAAQEIFSGLQAHIKELQAKADEEAKQQEAAPEVAAELVE
jgi:hypothetical protein